MFFLVGGVVRLLITELCLEALCGTADADRDDTTGSSG